jgi:chorismate mutase/prephenate dehydratase
MRLRTLEELRYEIDNIDKELVSLLEKRMDAVGEVALFKKKNGTPILDETREKQVISKNIERVVNDEYKSYIEDILKAIMDSSKEYQCVQIEK